MQYSTIEMNKKYLPNAAIFPEIVRLIDKGHTVTINLRGFSMRPFLEDMRDKAILGSPVNVKEGDVVLAEVAPQHYILHRLIKINGDNATLLGDGNLIKEYCKMVDIKAVALGFYRKERNKLDSTSGIKWRTYSWFWTNLYPIRRYLLAFYRHVWLKF